MDWRQLWEICSAPDNVPIVGLIPLLIFYIYLAWQQAQANDALIGELETNPALAKTHHRKSWPFRPGWQKEVHVWPFLLRVEFLAADRKSTRLNSSHGYISYAVFCLKKKKKSTTCNSVSCTFILDQALR